MTVRKFPINTKVVFNEVAGKVFENAPAGTIIGYSDDFFPIVLLNDPDPNSGDLAKVFHFSVLKCQN